MDWIKNNWVVVAVAIVVAIIIYYARRKKTESSFLITGCPGSPNLFPDPTTGICGRAYSWDQIPNRIAL